MNTNDIDSDIYSNSDDVDNGYDCDSDNKEKQCLIRYCCF